MVLGGFLVQVVLIGGMSLAMMSKDSFNRSVGAAFGCTMMLISYCGVYVASKGRFGFGDVKFSAQLGLATGWVGWETWLWALLLPFFLAGLLTLVLLVARRLTLQDHIAFGPFMSLGALIAVAATSSASI